MMMTSLTTLAMRVVMSNFKEAILVKVGVITANFRATSRMPLQEGQGLSQLKLSSQLLEPIGLIDQ